MPRGNAYSRVNWMRQVRRSRLATKARANSIASTGDSLAGPQFAISRPCETAKSWPSLPLSLAIGLSAHRVIEDDLDRISKIGLEKRVSRNSPVAQPGSISDPT